MKKKKYQLYIQSVSELFDNFNNFCNAFLSISSETPCWYIIYYIDDKTQMTHRIHETQLTIFSQCAYDFTQFFDQKKKKMLIARNILIRNTMSGGIPCNIFLRFFILISQKRLFTNDNP